MTLQERMLALKSEGKKSIAYRLGHKKAREDAAEIAKEADDIMNRMAGVLESASVGAQCINRALDVLDEFYDWEERTK